MLSDAEMIDDEKRGGPEPSGPHEEADMEDPPPLGPIKDAGPTPKHPLEMLSPPRKTPSSCSQHPNPEIQLLDLTAPGARLVWSREKWLS